MEEREADVVTCDVVGPICESSDVFGVERRLPLPAVGTLVAIFDAGAYGAAMASNYNRHPLPAEVLVDGGGWRVVRRRQTVDDQLAGESGGSVLQQPVVKPRVAPRAARRPPDKA